MPWVGWGTALVDFDNDGWPDCFTVNGHVDNNRKLLGQPVEYEEIPLLFRNDKGKRFRLATRDAGTVLRHQARRTRARPSATSTTTATSTSWSTTRTARAPCSATTPSRTTTGYGSSSRVPGAIATPSAPSSRSPSRTCSRARRSSGRSTASASRATACRPRTTRACWSGVGPTDRVKKVVIQWPSGIVSTLENLEVDRDYKVVEPKDGKPEPHRSKPEKKDASGK